MPVIIAAQDSYCKTRAVFLALVGSAYFVAFASLLVQLDGLYGEHGTFGVPRSLERNAWSCPQACYRFLSNLRCRARLAS